MAVWSEVKFSDINNSYGRLDSEYYRPEYLESDKILSTFDIYKLKEVSHKIDVGFVGTMKRYYCDNGIPLIQTQQVKEYFLNMNDFIQITPEFHKKLLKSQINRGDLLIARSGSFGKASIYLENEIVNSSDIIIIKIDENKINPFYVLAFLNSKNGSSQLIRFSSGGLQGHVNLTILEDFKIPKIKIEVQNHIASLVLKSYELTKKSQSLYTQAQELLERELGLDKLVFDKPLSYEARLSEVVGNNRADADYYQTRYKQLRSNISGNRTGIQRLIDFAIVLKPNIDPSKSPSSEFKYVELADINPTLGIINNANTFLGKELPSRARRVVTKGDVIASSVVGSVDKAALVDETNDGCLASTGFFHFRPKKNIKSEFLLLLVRSRCVTMQLQQESTGGILSAVPDQRLRNVIIPNIDLSIQNKIAALVCQSHKNFNQSKQLLEQAKRRVEELIEQAVQK